MREFWSAFLDGLASLSWLGDDYDCPVPTTSVSETLASDWNAVARDLAVAIRQIENDAQE